MNLDDPGYRRCCGWPGCDNWYHAVTGPTDRKWIRVSGSFWTGLRACPDHAEPTIAHQPTATTMPNLPDTSIVTCSCGAVSPVLTPGTYSPAYDWWCRHVQGPDRDGGAR